MLHICDLQHQSSVVDIAHHRCLASHRSEGPTHTVNEKESFSEVVYIIFDLQWKWFLQLFTSIFACSVNKESTRTEANIPDWFNFIFFEYAV